MSYSNRNTLRVEDVLDENGLKKTLRKSSSDPLMDLEYVSPVNQGRFSTIGRLESGVSLLQTAQIGIEKTKNWLFEIRQFLEGTTKQPYPPNMPKTVANQFISDRLGLIQTLVNSTSFQGRKVLDGSYGVEGKATGNQLKFVRGSARVATSPENGFAVRIVQPPKPSILVGTGQLTEDAIRNEEMIALNDGAQEVRYRLRNDETAETLLKNLKSCLINHQFDVDVYRSEDNRLLFRHNQLGSKNSFKGMSYRTPLISRIPGQYESSTAGIDIAGTIGNESAHGDGGFLIGDKGNKNTDGLVVFYNGFVDFPGQLVGYVQTTQNGIAIPLDVSESSMELLSLPSIDPEVLAVGVANSSGFENLGSIRMINEAERMDALRIVVWSIVYLRFLANELKQKEDDYVDRTIEMLHPHSTPFTFKDDEMFLTKNKAADMIGQINEMLKK